MTQIIFGPGVTPQLTDLDANFSELYARTALQSVSSDQTKFAGSVVATRAGDGGTAIFTNNAANLGYTAALFQTNTGATTVGSISCSTTSTGYNTTSDYRLKESIAPISGSGAFVDALKPCTWLWKSNGLGGTGFIAHELQTVSPGSVTGTKDAVDADGTPVFQAVEYGSAEVIAMLVAELQDVRRRLHAAGL